MVYVNMKLSHKCMYIYIFIHIELNYMLVSEMCGYGCKYTNANESGPGINVEVLSVAYIVVYLANFFHIAVNLYL